ncbi:Putative protein [Zobellia galactanivorans]|uniref:Uncharacterized protein n=1 Tax=Zobellia galactanivorans (strain DSM 12802 / CCUG 47099 / CIP 106680 / NCIMB 13871 / Dsij) TaxID=63186 RepID=G0L719_ZOBGA|nr:Putative protein [Zobellia galactanivorans]
MYKSGYELYISDFSTATKKIEKIFYSSLKRLKTSD